MLAQRDYQQNLKLKFNKFIIDQFQLHVLDFVECITAHKCLQIEMYYVKRGFLLYSISSWPVAEKWGLLVEISVWDVIWKIIGSPAGHISNRDFLQYRFGPSRHHPVWDKWAQTLQTFLETDKMINKFVEISNFLQKLHVFQTAQFLFLEMFFKLQKVQYYNLVSCRTFK